jgi:hypothetical protein
MRDVDLRRRTDVDHGKGVSTRAREVSLVSTAGPGDRGSPRVSPPPEAKVQAMEHNGKINMNASVIDFALWDLRTSIHGLGMRDVDLEADYRPWPWHARQ